MIIIRSSPDAYLKTIWLSYDCQLMIIWWSSDNHLMIIYLSSYQGLVCQSYDYRAIYIWNRRTTLTEEGCTEKCSFYLDENPISILKLSEDVKKPLTSMMSLWSGMMVNFNPPTEKWKWGTYFISSRMSGDASASLLKSKIYFCTKIMPKASSANPEEAIWWKQY